MYLYEQHVNSQLVAIIIVTDRPPTKIHSLVCGKNAYRASSDCWFYDVYGQTRLVNSVKSYLCLPLSSHEGYWNLLIYMVMKSSTAL